MGSLQISPGCVHRQQQALSVVSRWLCGCGSTSRRYMHDKDLISDARDILNEKYFSRVLHKFLSPLAHLGKQSKNLMKKHLPKWHLYLSPKEKELFFIESRMSTTHFWLAWFGQLLFLGLFQNACPNLIFTCPGQSGKCFCSLDVQRTSTETFIFFRTTLAKINHTKIYCLGIQVRNRYSLWST